MRCSCGTIFKRSFGNIKHRKSFLCVSCAQKMRHKKDKINNQIIDKMNQKFLEKGLVILQEIENSRDKILCRTQDGYCGRISYANLVKGKMFSYFSIKFNKEFLINNLNIYAKNNNLDVKVICFEKKNRQTMENMITCQCECGNIFNIKISSFLYCNGYRCPVCAKSCSIYERTIEKEIQKYKIIYEKEKVFEDCRNPETNFVLYFNFYIPSKNILIEVDGEQHFKKESVFHSSTEKEKEENFIKLKNRDNFKNFYALQNGITLIRISYKDIINKKYIKIIQNIVNN